MNKVILGEYCTKLSASGGCDCNKFAGYLDPVNFDIISKLIPAHDGCDCQAQVSEAESVIVYGKDMTREDWIGFNWVPTADVTGQGQTFIKGEPLSAKESARRADEWPQFRATVLMEQRKLEEIDTANFKLWVRQEIAVINQKIEEILQANNL